MKMEKIKLVIWDLDETFWKGTLSEEGVSIIEENVELIKELARRGIICSISSKNDFDAAKKILEKAGVWDYFIFPSINWNPKGESIKRIIEECQLRAPNVLFIDDNVSNRKEVEHYNVGINTISEKEIPSLLIWPELKGKDDSNLSRLKQYKILEEKAKVKETYSDNHSFLVESDIHIEFIADVKSHRDRVLELINRTNQLNFTKIRLTEEDVDGLLDNKDIESVCIHVVDKFGDYGICGFYSLNKKENHLIHFLFSCRILNLGIETYVYNKIGNPTIDIVEPVAGSLKSDGSIDWINEGITETADKEISSQGGRIRLLMLGGCDLEQMCHYLNPNRFDVIKEFNYPNAKGVPVHREHTVYIRELEKLSPKERDEISLLPFCDPKMFDTQLFSGEYDVLVYSVLMNYTHSVYKHKEYGFKIAYGGYMDPESLSNHLHLTNKEKETLLSKYEYCGLQTAKDFIEDLDWLVKRVNKKILFINGAETHGVNESEPDAVARHIEMNKVLDEFVSKHSDQCQILDVRQFVTSAECHKDTIRHYQRPVYVEMAKQLILLIDPTAVSTSDFYIKKAKLEGYIKMIKEKLLHDFRVVIRGFLPRHQ